MKLCDDPPLHLTYCLNVHAGESWEENFAAIRSHALSVRDRVRPGGPFALGLRLSRRAAEELGEGNRLGELKRFCADENLYVFTVNAFPYGRFHGSPVKQGVYAPDWRTDERREYTLAVARVLGELLDEGEIGSISTVPLTYKGWGWGDGVGAMADNLAVTAAGLAEIRERTGKDICLALEPEPDCLLETTAEAISFFEGPLARRGAARLADDGFGDSDAGDMLRRHVGICLDAAHAAVEFEDPGGSLAELRAAEIRVAKVQLSAALRLKVNAGTVRRLREFTDQVYLHQVKQRNGDGQIVSYADLDNALSAAERAEQRGAEWRVHFHVPLFFAGDGGLGSTADLLGDRFARELAASGCSHAEIETYTWDVLPAEMRGDDVAADIAREYEWVLDRLPAP